MTKSTMHSVPDTSMVTSNTEAALLNLPAELRSMILQHCFHGMVLYTRSNCTGREWYKRLEICDNSSSQLLLVSKQLSAEAFEAMLHTCVLDIWGATSNRDVFSHLPLVVEQIRHVAVSEHRCRLFICALLGYNTDESPVKDFHDCIPGMPSLESLFIDAVPATATKFVSRWKTIIAGGDSLGRPDFTCVAIRILFSLKAVCDGERYLRVYVRCATFHEVSGQCAYDCYVLS